jgi:hypothetical protein
VTAAAGGSTIRFVASWYSIEVLDGATPASRWADAFGDALVEVALTFGAQDWDRHQLTWGVVIEVCLPDDDAWDAFREAAAVKAALDNVPDPVTGLILYRGRGGSSGAKEPRRPRPLIGSGSASLPLPWELGLDDLVPLQLPGVLAVPALSQPATASRR